MENASNLRTTFGMFSDCINLIEIEFPYIYSNSLREISLMFSGCENIKRVNLEKLYAENVLKTILTFQLCHNLEYLNIFNLNTLNAEDNTIFPIFAGIDKNNTNIIIEYDENKTSDFLIRQIEEVAPKNSN